jgi:hypothetical protein
MMCIPLGSLTLLVSNLVWNEVFIILQTSVIFNSTNTKPNFGIEGVLLNQKTPNPLFNDVDKRVTIPVFL